MRYLACLVLLLVLGVFGTALGSDYSMAAFNAQYKALNDDAELEALYRAFLENATDMEVLRNAQNSWNSLDKETAVAFVKAKAETNPSDVRWQYLYGRVIESPTEQIKAGRKIVALDKAFAYGYRLIVATYDAQLFSGGSGPVADTLTGWLPQDAPLFDAYIEAMPTEGFPYQMKFAYLAYSGELSEGAALMERAKAASVPNWPTAADRATLSAARGDFIEARKIVEEDADARIAKGGNPKNRESSINRGYATALRTARAWDELIAYRSKADSSGTNNEIQYDIACFYALSGHKDEAFAWLSKAASNGYDNTLNLKEDSDLDPLRTDSRWSGVVEAVNGAWDKGKEARRAKALEAKDSGAAPDFSLPGIDGKLVSLSELKGNTIVLDFWATWCGPCKISMPAIDKFLRSHGRNDVKVFSVDVWEKGKKGPRTYMEKNNYGMTLLYGNDDIATAFGVEAIPTLVVLDKEGNMRFRHVGVVGGLDEYLAAWVEACDQPLSSHE